MIQILTAFYTLRVHSARSIYTVFLQNVGVQWLALRIRVVSSSILGSETGHPETFFAIEVTGEDRGIHFH
jgi:hypothetical protein